jgi:hypothetical protein
MGPRTHRHLGDEAKSPWVGVIREFILCIRLGGGMYNLIVVRVRLHAL